MLVLEKHYGIVAANGGAQQTGEIERGGRHDHAQTGSVSENSFAALAVIDRAAGEISADGHADNRGAGESARGAPAHQSKFVAKLHHGGPDVIEELNFDDGFQSANGHADGAADNICFGERRIENAVGAIAALQSPGGFEDAALPFHFFDVVFAADVGNVFAEHNDAFVARHFRGERGGNHFDHGLRFAFENRSDIERF